MDERYLFYAASDPDWFDVPWGGGGAGEEAGDDLDRSWAAPDGWRTGRRGPWVLHRAPGPLPASGWKLHVTATPAAAPGTVALVAGVCARTQTSWKVLRSTRLVRATQGKYAPRTLSGKVCTLYPSGDEQLEVLLDDLGARLAGRPGPCVTGDLTVPGTPLSLRWGAFAPAWTSTAAGSAVAARRADGRLVPDDRTRAVPDDVTAPECVRRVQVAARASAATARLDVSDVRLLHRSSAGGVYAGRRRGRPVVLKEARHHSGVDAGGQDAPTRLRREAAVLERLRGAAIAPTLHEVLTCGGSDFLVMERLDGPNLALATAQRHPCARPGAGADELREHHAWAERSADELDGLLARLHALGVVHGDLHPGNVVCTPGGLRLVDFEAAALDGEPLTSGIAAPGFDVGDRADPRERDRACADRVRLALHVPDALLLHRRPDLEDEFRAAADRGRVGAAPDAGRTAAPDAGDLAAGLVACADPSRADRLFPGGVEQFQAPLAAAGLLHGAGGVLLALAAAGVPAPDGALRWLVRASAPGPAGTPWPGLADGAHGVALCLAVLGAGDEASRLADALLPADEAAAVDATDLSWASGLAGRAVAHARLARLLGRPELARLAEHLALRTADAVLEEERAAGPAGLLRGWAGTALGLRRVAQGAAAPGRLDEAALRAVQREEQRLHRCGAGVLARDGGALLPFLGDGSAAAGLASAAVHGRAPDAPGAELREAVRRTASTPNVPTAGLLAGRTGLLLTLQLLRGGGCGDAGARSIAMHRSRLGWHAVPSRTGTRVLGAQNLRFSADLATGAAGVLLASLPDGGAALAGVLQLPLTPVTTQW